MQAWLPTILGMVAGTCSTFAFVPQVLKIWREGDTHAISLRMYLMRVTGFVLWLWYGFVIGSAPIIIFNIVSLALGGTVLLLKLRAGGRLAHLLGIGPRDLQASR